MILLGILSYIGALICSETLGRKESGSAGVSSFLVLNVDFLVFCCLFVVLNVGFLVFFLFFSWFLL